MNMQRDGSGRNYFRMLNRIIIFHIKHSERRIVAMVSLCQCDNSPTFVLQNSVSVARKFAVQRLANCHIDSLFCDKVKPSLLYVSHNVLNEK